MPSHNRKSPRSPGWDAVADWYDGWMGDHGSEHHQRLAIPTAIEMLSLEGHEHVLDIGAGQGVFAQYVAQTGARYTGVDISPHLIEIARSRHAQHGRFIRADARRLESSRDLKAASFDACIFLLSLQDMSPLDAVTRSAAWALKPKARLVIVMTHPCFRVPRQSGWGYDSERQLRYRRIDSYLQMLSVPMKAYGRHRTGTTISFHRPLEAYINALANEGLYVDAMREISSFKAGDKVERRAEAQIPLFLALRARRVEL
jgi:SAM-dependent methyltransferase